MSNSRVTSAGSRAALSSTECSSALFNVTHKPNNIMKRRDGGEQPARTGRYPQRHLILLFVFCVLCFVCFAAACDCFASLSSGTRKPPPPRAASRHNTTSYPPTSRPASDDRTSSKGRAPSRQQRLDLHSQVPSKWKIASPSAINRKIHLRDH